MARSRLVLAAVLAGAGIAAGAALALAGSTDPDDAVLAIELGDGAIAVDPPALASGRRVIEATNVGTTEHELVVLETDSAPDELAVGLHGVSIKHSGRLVLGEDHLELGHRHRPGEVLGLLPGESRRYQVDLGPGHYVVYCQTDGHYLGMDEAAEFSVD